jgi:prolyl-tRNA synthetase
MDVTYLDAEGRRQRVIMGCYGIGVERLAASAVEQWHDDGGIIWPVTIAPFQVILTLVGKNPEVVSAAKTLNARMAARWEVLYDDRDLSPGVKFKDADLLGIPIRVVISPKLLQKDQVEIKVRKTGDVYFCPTAELMSVIKELVETLQPNLDGLPFLAE